jgi:arylsulfatase A-like enzyme
MTPYAAFPETTIVSCSLLEDPCGSGGRRSVWALVGVLVVAVGLTACGPSGPGGRNILVITTDTTRADFVGAYGADLGVTPRLDALAQQGVVFENAYAPMPQTLPSHSTLFTGLDPRQHLALENTYQLDEAFRTLAELAQERGYATGAFIGALVLDQETGIQQGFETFDIPQGVWNEKREGHPPQRSAEEVTRVALEWADDLDPAEPYLMWAHYYDPHGDHATGFEPPKRHLAQVDRKVIRKRVQKSASLSGDLPLEAQVEYWAQYAAEIRYMDEQIGRLLDGLGAKGLLGNTLVVVVGDHGEGLYEHGIKAHGVYVWEEMHRIPMILVHPDGEHAGRRVAGRAALRDIEPTIKRIAMDIPGTGGEDFGFDLWEHLSDSGLPDRPIFLERPHFDRERVVRRINGVDLTQQNAYGYLTAVIMGRHKLIRHPDGTLRLYDLEADPQELVDVAAQESEQVSKMSGLLSNWMEAHEVGQPGEGVEISDERRARLKALGYL